MYFINNMTNTSSEIPVAYLPTFNILPILFIMSLISIATITGNGLVCLAIWKDPHKQLRSPFSPYVLNLSVTDFLVGSMTHPLHIAYKLTDTTYPGVVRPYYEICFFILGSASALSLCLLCLDRYNAMVYPLAYRTRDRKARFVILVTLVWIIAIVYPILTYCFYGYTTLLYYFLHVVALVTFCVLLLTCSSILMFKDKSHMPTRCESIDVDQGEEERFVRCKRMASRLSDSSVFFDLVRRRFSSSLQTTDNDLSDLSKIFNKRSMKMGRIFIVMLCQFITCFLPPIVLVNYVNGCQTCLTKTKDIMYDVIHLSVALFSMLNPFIYCWRLSNYRTALWVIIGVEQVKRRGSYIPESNSLRNNFGSDSFCDVEVPMMYPDKVYEEDEVKIPVVAPDDGCQSARAKRRAFSMSGKMPALRGSFTEPDYDPQRQNETITVRSM